MKKKTLIKTLYIAYLLFIIVFIFSNSLPSIEESAETSGRLLTFINNILEMLKIPVMESDTFIRKTAHFAEFFVLGASLIGYYNIDKKCNCNNVIKSILFVCIIAMTDETIQHFTGRGSLVLDVWLDLFGGTVGILSLFQVFNTYNRKNQK